MSINRTTTGWQRHPRTRVWHYYPGSLWYSYSICERYTRGAWPLQREPKSINVCERCVKAMRKLAEKLDDPDDPVKEAWREFHQGDRMGLES